MCVCVCACVCVLVGCECSEFQFTRIKAQSCIHKFTRLTEQYKQTQTFNWVDELDKIHGHVAFLIAEQCHYGPNGVLAN